MEKINGPVPGSFTDIRYNIFYSVGLSTVAIIMIVIYLLLKEKNWYYDFFLILAVLFLVYGISALIRTVYLRLDKQSKTVKINDNPIFWMRRYKYDRLFFNDNKLYREIDGKTEFININRYQCRKNDLEAFIVEVNKAV
jgi:ABC-type transport system involved in Fe-S cluster assembly fused permease/ATPase subunit